MAVSSITFSGIAVPGIEDSKSLCYYHTLRLREENQFLDSETYYFQQREFYLQLWWQRSPIYSIKLPFRTGQNFPAKYSGGQDQPRPPPTGRPLLGVWGSSEIRLGVGPDYPGPRPPETLQTQTREDSLCLSYFDCIALSIGSMFSSSSSFSSSGSSLTVLPLLSTMMTVSCLVLTTALL